jgi:hypothetical protein
MGELADLGASTRGIWTREQALAATTRGRVDALVRRGEWQSPWPGVYADGGITLDVEQRGFAAVLASGGDHEPVRTAAGKRVLRAAACGRLAARLHQLPLIDDDDPATGGREHLIDDVAVGWGGRALTGTAPDGTTWTLLRHRRHYGRRELTKLPSGLWATSYAATVADCALLLQPDALVCLLDALLHRRLLTPEALQALVQQRAWLPGAPALRQAVAMADGRAESPNETVVRLVLTPHLPGLVPQQRLRDDRGRSSRASTSATRGCGWRPRLMGSSATPGDRMAARDQRRDRISDARGWRTERCTWFEARCRKQELVRRMLEAAGDQARRLSLS